MHTKLSKRILSGAAFAAVLATLWAAPLPAQSPDEPQWVTNQAARLVVGQTTFTRSNPQSSREAIGSAGGVAVGGNRLYIADGNRIAATPVNNRVLVYDNLDGFIPELDDEIPQDDNCPACVGLPDIVLGQPDFDTFELGVENGMRAPSGVATDGQIVAVADTNNNRVLIWRNPPTSMNQRADVVVGQPDFSDNLPRTSREGMRGPQGLWIDGGKLFVADTQNSRILIWNSIPTSNGQGADLVIGQPDFDTRPEPDLTQANFEPTQSNMLDPTSVQVVDGKMFVSDLGFERVLIWLNVPTSNTFPADVVVGQPDFTTSGFVDHDDNLLTPSLRRSVIALCEQIGQFDDDGTVTPDDNIFPPPINRDPDLDDDGEIDPTEPRYPKRCESTLNFPRFALSDGQRLFVADSGNDRILIWNEIPTENGAAADVVLGQPDFIALEERSGPAGVRAPTSLAHDGENLYVADPFSRRVLVFTPALPMLANEGVRNAASFEIVSQGWVEWEGDTEEDQLITVEIARQPYEFRTEPGDTAEDVRDRMMQLLNDDPDGLVDARPFNGQGTFAQAFFTFSGEVRTGDRITLRIGDETYTHTVLGGNDDPGPFILVDRFNFLVDQSGRSDVIVNRDIADINTLLITSAETGPALNGLPVSIDLPAGSPTVVESSGDSLQGGAFPRRMRLTSRLPGRLGNAIELSSQTGGAGITTAASGGRLSRGSNAQLLPAGSIAAAFGEGLADQVVSAQLVDGKLPTELAGVQVYVNGLRAPIYSVAPNQVNYQVPFAAQGRGISTYVRRTMPDGSVRVSIPRGNPSSFVTLTPLRPEGFQEQRVAPGVFALAGPEPRQAVALHGQGQADAQIGISGSTDGTADEAGDVTSGATVTITVNGRAYTYFTVEGDTASNVRDRLVERINEGDGDPEVIASAGVQGFFSARAQVTLTGDPNPGDTITLTVNGRDYVYTAQEGDTVDTARNILVDRVNAGAGDPDVSAQRQLIFGTISFEIEARRIGEEGNNITFSATASDGAAIMVETNLEGDTLERGQTPPVVILTAREPGPEGNNIQISAESDNARSVNATARTSNLCCGNIPFSLITQENPAIPGEVIILYASGLGRPAIPDGAELPDGGEPTPMSPLFDVPENLDDFVSSQIGERTATLLSATLAPGFVGLYQVNLRLNETLPDDPVTPGYIAQTLFFSNTFTIPIRNIPPPNN